VHPYLHLAAIQLSYGRSCQDVWPRSQGVKVSEEETPSTLRTLKQRRPALAVVVQTTPTSAAALHVVGESF
jgi:hypothetical protein